MLESMQSTKLINVEKNNMDKLNISVHKGKLKSRFYDYVFSVGYHIGVLECVMHGFRDSVVGLQPLLLSFISE